MLSFPFLDFSPVLHMILGADLASSLIRGGVALAAYAESQALMVQHPAALDIACSHPQPVD